MSFGERLQKYLTSHDMDQKDLAKMIGRTNQTISGYTTGKNKPSYDDFIKICNILQVDASYFMKDELEFDSSSKEPEFSVEDIKIINSYKNLSEHDKGIVDYIFKNKDVIEIPEPKIIYRLPVYNQAAAAGVGVVGYDNKYETEDVLFTNKNYEKAKFIVTIAHHSMSPQIQDGDKVLVNPQYFYSDLHDKIVIAQFGEQIICKRFLDKGDHILFESDNDSCSSENRIAYNRNEFSIIGVVIGIIRDDEIVSVE